jgi:DNA-binding NarL/FixJ family response regulator
VPKLSRTGTLDGSVFVNVADDALAGVLVKAVDDAALVSVPGASQSAILVSDDLERDEVVPRACTIEVVEARPRCARRAIDNATGGVSQGFVLADVPESLAHALADCMREGVFISARAIAVAARFPRLSVRQDEVLARIAQGESLPSICRALNMAPTTAKRDVRVVERRLGVSGRADLAAAAVALGFPPRRARHKR